MHREVIDDMMITMIRMIMIVRNDDGSDDQEYGWMDGWMCI